MRREKTLVRTVAVIGAGVIGGAIVKCILRSKITESVIATRRNLDTLIPLADLGCQYL